MNPPNSETPRTDDFVNSQAIRPQKRVVKFIHQLEKELNEAKAAIQLMETGKYGRVDLSEQIRSQRKTNNDGYRVH